MFGPALTLVLALASSAVIASPTVDNVYKRAVASLNPSSTVLPFHFPKSVYENTPYSGATSFSFSKEDDVKTATDFISKKLNLGADDFKASAHVKNGQVTSFSSSFGTAQHFSKSDLAVSAAKATVDFEKASATASAQLGIPVYSDFKHALEYVEQPDGKIVYAYKLQLRDNPATNNRGKTTPSTSDGVFDTKFNSTEQPYDDANVAAAAVNLFYLTTLCMISHTNTASLKGWKLPKEQLWQGRERSRLTGGAATSGCLSTAEAQGLGEGWSDMFGSDCPGQEV
ncbi:hypothetical protein BASA62_010095 [Batrachochytrium salamandrivorans]|nr:hypothetical protein BASA62_010095 [Batrachochytrium salamandrivorans]